MTGVTPAKDLPASIDDIAAMLSRFAILSSLLLVTALTACGGTSATCTSSAVQHYASPTLVVPTSGATDVSPQLPALVVTTHSARFVGTINLNGPGGAVNLVPTLVTQTGSLYTWKVPVSGLSSQAHYTLRYSELSGRVSGAQSHHERGVRKLHDRIVTPAQTRP